MRTTSLFNSIKTSAAGASARLQEDAEPSVPAIVILLGATLVLMLAPALVAVLAMFN